jgi:hypothetical protein
MGQVERQGASRVGSGGGQACCWMLMQTAGCGA